MPPECQKELYGAAEGAGQWKLESEAQPPFPSKQLYLYEKKVPQSMFFWVQWSGVRGSMERAPDTFWPLEDRMSKLGWAVVDSPRAL